MHGDQVPHSTRHRSPFSPSPWALQGLPATLRTNPNPCVYTAQEPGVIWLWFRCLTASPATSVPLPRSSHPGPLPPPSLAAPSA